VLLLRVFVLAKRFIINILLLVDLQHLVYTLLIEVSIQADKILGPKFFFASLNHFTLAFGTGMSVP
jgi:hypothetical protein